LNHVTNESGIIIVGTTHCPLLIGLFSTKRKRKVNIARKMHSLVSRANALFAFTTFVLFGLLFLNVLSSYFIASDPKVNLKVAGVDRFRKQYQQENDQAVLKLDIDTDLRSLFNWNTKQLFCYITAEYKTSQHAVNQVVVWDKIITNKEDALFNYENVWSKYPLSDEGSGLRNNLVSFTFSWNLIPISGLLPRFTLGSHSITFPAEYTQ